MFADGETEVTAVVVEQKYDTPRKGKGKKSDR
jgi:hypothetical protein